jgi:hypothetical protein
MTNFIIISLGIIAVLGIALYVFPAFAKRNNISVKERNPLEYTVDYIKEHLEKWKTEAVVAKQELQNHIKDSTDTKKLEITKNLQKKLDEAESQIKSLNQKLNEMVNK